MDVSGSPFFKNGKYEMEFRDFKGRWSAAALPPPPAFAELWRPGCPWFPNGGGLDAAVG
jgi:hypothetical protein